MLDCDLGIKGDTVFDLMRVCPISNRNGISCYTCDHLIMEELKLSGVKSRMCTSYLDRAEKKSRYLKAHAVELNISRGFY